MNPELLTQRMTARQENPSDDPDDCDWVVGFKYDGNKWCPICTVASSDGALAKEIAKRWNAKVGKPKKGGPTS